MPEARAPRPPEVQRMNAGGSGNDGGGGAPDSLPSPESIPSPDSLAARSSMPGRDSVPPRESFPSRDSGPGPISSQGEPRSVRLSSREPRALGRYEILVPIADGGMASVWAARMKGQRGFQKIVAIKQMRPELSDDPNFEAMFLDEAALVSQLKHPNIAEIFDLGEEDDKLYQVMEYVDGEPLNRLLRQRRGPLPVSLVVYIGKEVCAGLHVAHELRDDKGNLVGLVHRDVSLQNILVTYEGVTKVIDFGVAKALSNQGKTNVGQVKGKVPYMSPEQAVGDEVDRRTDVFALGIVLYQLATAKHPFRGDTELETMMRICEKTPVAPPSTLVPTIPKALDEVLGKALAKDKNARYASMSELLRALEGVLPPREQASAEDLATFMQTLLGSRGDQRRQAIQEAGRLADLAAAGEKKNITGSPYSARSPLSVPHSAPLSAPRSMPLGMPLSVPGSGPRSVPGSGPRSVPPPSHLRGPSSVPSSIPADRTVGGQEMPAPRSRSWSRVLAGTTRNILIAVVMGAAGIGIGAGALSVVSPESSMSPIALAYPALENYRAVSSAGSKAAASAPAAPSAAATGGAPGAGAGAASASALSTPKPAAPKSSQTKPRGPVIRPIQ